MSESAETQQLSVPKMTHNLISAGIRPARRLCAKMPFGGQTTHLGPDVVLSIQPIWVPSSRDRGTSHLCDAASLLRSGPPRPRGKGARPEPTKRHEHGRGTPSGEGRTLAADHGRGLR